MPHFLPGGAGFPTAGGGAGDELAAELTQGHGYESRAAPAHGGSAVVPLKADRLSLPRAGRAVSLGVEALLDGELAAGYATRRRCGSRGHRCRRWECYG